VGGYARGGGKSGADTGPPVSTRGSGRSGRELTSVETTADATMADCDHAHALIEAQVPGAHGPRHESRLSQPLAGFAGTLAGCSSASATVAAASRPWVMFAIGNDAATIVSCALPCPNAQSVPLPSSASCRRSTLESAAQTRRTIRMETLMTAGTERRGASTGAIVSYP
jgi:hypothetical protein